MNAFKVFIALHTQRLNALQFRERILVLGVILICMIAVLDMFIIEPVLDEHRALLKVVQTKKTELEEAHTQYKLVTSPSKESQTDESERALITERIAMIQKELVAPQVTEPQTSVAEALVYILKQYQGLKLLHTALLPETSPTVGASMSSDTKTLQPITTPSRQGVEIKISGVYSDLVAYIQRIERSMPDVRWGPMSIKHEHGISELTLQIFLLNP